MISAFRQAVAMMTTAAAGSPRGLPVMAKEQPIGFRTIFRTSQKYSQRWRLILTVICRLLPPSMEWKYS